MYSRHGDSCYHHSHTFNHWLAIQARLQGILQVLYNSVFHEWVTRNLFGIKSEVVGEPLKTCSPIKNARTDVKCSFIINNADGTSYSYSDWLRNLSNPQGSQRVQASPSGEPGRKPSTSTTELRAKSRTVKQH